MYTLDCRIDCGAVHLVHATRCDTNHRDFSKDRSVASQLRVVTRVDARSTSRKSTLLMLCERHIYNSIVCAVDCM